MNMKTLLSFLFVLVASMAVGQVRIDQFDSVGSVTTPYGQIGSDSYFWLVNEQAPAAPLSRRMSIYAFDQVLRNLGLDGSGRFWDITGSSTTFTQPVHTSQVQNGNSFLAWSINQMNMQFNSGSNQHRVVAGNGGAVLLGVDELANQTLVRATFDGNLELRTDLGGGAKYFDNYTLTDPLALTHKAYVDGVIPSGTNGLTSFNNQIFLGGEITSTTGLTLINGNWTIGTASGDINYQISPTNGISYNVFEPNFQDGVFLNLNPFGTGSMQLGYTNDAGTTVAQGMTLDNVSVQINSSGNVVITPGVGTGYLILNNLATSAAGLPSGAVWNNGGVLTIVP